MDVNKILGIIHSHDGDAVDLAKSLGGALELRRAQTAKKRAGGQQLPPSKFMPNVPRQVHATEGRVVDKNKNFENWFGYSHVVNEHGKPMVLYHGTDADFSTFDSSKSGSTDHGWYGIGHYLTSNPELASAYSGYKNTKAIMGDEIHPGQNVMPVYVRLENPYIWPENRPAATSREEAEKITHELKMLGHDGVIAPNKHVDGHEGKFWETVVFNPHQIKSATGNSGDFDTSNPDITKAEGGIVYPEAHLVEHVVKADGGEIAAPPAAQIHEPHKRAEEQGYSIKGYHVTRGKHANAISSASRFDPEMARSHGEVATFFWDNPDAANEWAHYSSGVHTFDPDEMSERDVDRAERHATAVMPVRIHPGKHLEVDWPEETGQNDYDNRQMAKIIRKARAEGYDTIRIKNMIESGVAESLQDEDFENYKPHDQIAVLNPAMIRSEFAKFDPEHQGRDDIGAKRGGFIHPAMMIHGVHINTAQAGEPIFTGEL